MRLRDLSAVLILFFCCLSAHAGTTCYQWTVTGLSSYFGSLGEACTAYMSYYNTNNIGGSNLRYTSASPVFSSFPTGSCSMVLHNSSSNVDTTPSVSASYRTNPDGCPSCPQSGTSKNLSGSSGDAPSSTCSGGCGYTQQGPKINFGSGWNNAGDGGTMAGYIGTYVSTGNACGSTSTDQSTSIATSNDCKMSSAGAVVCMEPAGTGGQNCGVYNGDTVCVKAMSPSSCDKFESGAAACLATTGLAGNKTATPPGPDNGTAGAPATPQMQITDDSGRTGNYYTSEQVSGSTVPVNSSGSSSSSSGGSSSSGSSSSSAGSECGTSGVSCSFTAPSTTTDDTISSLGSSFVAGVQATPLYSAVSGLADSWPSGTCPSASFSLWGQSYNFMTSACDIWADDVAPVLSLVMMAVYSLGAIFIVLKA